MTGILKAGNEVVQWPNIRAASLAREQHGRAAYQKVTDIQGVRARESVKTH